MTALFSGISRSSTPGHHPRSHPRSSGDSPPSSTGVIVGANSRLYQLRRQRRLIRSDGRIFTAPAGADCTVVPPTLRRENANVGLAAHRNFHSVSLPTPAEIDEEYVAVRRRPVGIYTGHGRRRPRRRYSSSSSGEEVTAEKRNGRQDDATTLAILERPRKPIDQIISDLAELRRAPVVQQAAQTVTRVGTDRIMGKEKGVVQDGEWSTGPAPLKIAKRSSRRRSAVSDIQNGIPQISAEEIMEEVDAEIDGIIGRMNDPE